MFTIRKKFKFEMAHQLSSAYSACCKDTIHGHSYILELFFSGNPNEDGMVIDFTKVKQITKKYIDNWDHALVMHWKMGEKYLEILKRNNKKLIITSYNPTAELMCFDMFNTLNKLFSKKDSKNYPCRYKLTKVRLHETETGWSQWEEGITYVGRN